MATKNKEWPGCHYEESDQILNLDCKIDVLIERTDILHNNLECLEKVLAWLCVQVGIAIPKEDLEEKCHE